MSKDSKYIHSLIAKSLTDRIDEAEEIELEKWKDESFGNLQKYNDIVSLWIKSGSMKLPHEIDQSHAFEVFRKNAGISFNRKIWITRAIQAAAVLILSVLFSGIYSQLNHENSDFVAVNGSLQTTYNEIKAAYGTQAKVELEDGTIVFLNSGSKLRFPHSFINQAQRKVVLDGEAFFKVAKNKSVPFIVQTNKVNVKVLGTTFNVDAYSDNPSVHVALVEGSVMLQDASSEKTKDLMSLAPAQVATLNTTDKTLKKTDVTDLYKYTAWINGRIIFFGDPIQVVVKKLEKWYNVEIIIADKRLDNYRFTGTFIDESLEQILNILSRTSSMTYAIQPIKKQADNSMSKRRIILKDKIQN